MATSTQTRKTSTVYYDKALSFVSQYRVVLALALAVVAGSVYYAAHPFGSDEPLLAYLSMTAAPVYVAFRYVYLFIVFGLPFFIFYFVLSQLFVRAMQPREGTIYQPLPPYPETASRHDLFLVLGETHNRFNFERAKTPHWCILPERGMYTGITIFGGIGGGKTSSLMYPLCQQLVEFRATDTAGDKKLSGLVLEVKGDFCHRVQSMMGKVGRGSDYVEISLDPRYCYNPLYNNMDAYARAFQISSVMAQIFGKSSEPYWTIQSTALMKNIIRLYELADQYVTITDVLTAASNIEVLYTKLQETKKKLGSSSHFLLSEQEYLNHFPALASLSGQWEAVQINGAKKWQVPASSETAEGIIGLGLYLWPRSSFATQEQKDCQFISQEIERWAKEWQGYDPKLRGSIVSSVSGILALFTDTPEAARVFCPSKELYLRTEEERKLYPHDPVPLPRFSTMIEQGRVVGVNFPTALNPSLAKILCTMIKADFQKAMLNRIPKMAINPDKHFRPVFLMVDEYHLLCALGGNSNDGDEHFFSLSRQSKCIPILATQSITSLKTATGGGDTYKTLLQAIRTSISLATNDLDTAKHFADYIGKMDKLKTNYTINESAQDASVSLLSGQTVGNKSSVSHGLSYSTQKEHVFETHDIIQLPNAVAVAMIYDGGQAQSQALFTIPYYTSREKTWHEKQAAGEITTTSSDIDRPTYVEEDAPFGPTPTNLIPAR